MKWYQKLIIMVSVILTLYYSYQFKQDIQFSLIAGAIMFVVAWIYFWIGSRKKSKREPIPQYIKDEVLKRQGGTCALCSEHQLLDLHHKKPVHLGGLNTAGNLILLCPNHHALAHRREQR